MGIPTKTAALPDLKTLHERLLWAREKKGWGSNQLAIKAAVSHNTVSRIHRGEAQNMEALTAFKLARVLDVNAQWLVCGYEDPLEIEVLRGRGTK